MAIVREGSTSHMTAINQSSATFSYSLVNPSGNDRLMVVGVNYEEDTINTRHVTGVTYGGQAMTQLPIAPIKWPDTGLMQYVDYYYILDANLPASAGANNCVVTLDGVVAADEIMCYLAEYSGVNQAVPDDSDFHENESAGNTSVTITAAAAGSAGILVCGSGGTTDPSGNENNLTTLHSHVGVSAAGALGELLNQSGGFTFGYNSLSTREGCIGAVWQPTAASGWSGGTINGVINLGKVNSVDDANIAKVNTV